MRKYFKSLTELEEKGYTVLDEKNISAIEECLEKEIDVYVTDDLKIESEAGIYLGEVSYEKPY